MTRIVVAGEALIDRMVLPDGSVVETPGGGPFNAARTMARLGADVAFLGRLSSDAAGRRLRAALAADGVDLEPASTTDDPTTAAIATLDPQGGAAYRFDAAGTSAAGLVWSDLAAAGLQPSRIDALHVGTLGLALEPSGTTIERLTDALRTDALLVLDPNVRLAATRDPDVLRARIGRIAGRADVVKVSHDDLRSLDAAGDAEAALRRLREAGPALILVTNGAAPVEIITIGARRQVPVPVVAVVDTIGAGDAFGGGFLATWVLDGRGRDDLGDIDLVEGAVRTAVIVAALTCQRLGADPPSRAALDAALGSMPRARR